MYKILFLACIALASCSKGSGDRHGLAEGITVTVTPISISQIDVSWNAVDGADAYEVRFSPRGDMGSATSMQTASISLALTGLEAGTRYHIQVRAQTGTVWQEWSDIVQARTAAFEASFGTYNILGVAHDDTYPNNTWATRKLAVRDIILQAGNHPDIFGIQEAIETVQMDEVLDLLDGYGYDSYVSAREISCRAIFWKADRFRLIDAEDVDMLPATTTSYQTQRYATHVVLEHMAMGHKVDVYNIHLTYGSAASRQQIRNTCATRLAQLIRQRYEARNHPAVVVGDYNNYFETVIDGIQGSPRFFINYGFSDTFHSTPNRTNYNYMTSNDLMNALARRGPENGNSRIDYIMYYPAERTGVTDYRIILNLAEGTDVDLVKPVPSDHNPVRSTLQLFYDE